jgi:prepilin-type N-terminal cleavage/methylation domain-containing protein
MPTPLASLRRGVSLPEVLVAAVLLAIGIAGTLSALSTSVRFRAMGLARESIAAAAAGRVSWFESEGCASPDTLIASPTGARLEERWQLSHEPGAVRLHGAATMWQAGRSHRLPIETRRACE